MILYLLQTVAFQLLFLIVYELLLKKETFFQWNRIYLCFTPLLALILPFIKIPALQKAIPQNFVVSLPEIIIRKTTTATQNTIATSNPPFALFEIILLAGIAISTLLFLWKLYKIIQLKRKGKTETLANTTIIHLPNSADAFSFANLIFLGENLDLTAKKHIITHEMVHIKQKHYFDLLFFELLRIIFWFNPMMYLFQNRVATLHEFIADTQAVEATDKKNYYQNLLSEVFQTRNISFINTFFNHSLIKKRIVMLQKSKSKKSQLIKYAFLLPVLAGMLMVSSCEQTETQITKEESSMHVVTIDTIKGGKSTIDDVPFAIIDQVPIYPGCGNLSTNEERKICMSKSIDLLVRENFDTSIGKNSGLTGRQRISVQFKIDNNGNVVDVMSRAAVTTLEEEAMRVINLLPKMQPGKQDGKEVGVLYSLPIIFEVQSEE
ncbi:MAG: energy transducer TonB [Flavobacteriales bacterium]|jgi:beta-lactamase regulating signal transducer with metallopeptidase domain|nr:energy transducer TonB [Flavobacteriales bacterium]